MLYTYTILNHYEGVYESYMTDEELCCSSMYFLNSALCTVVELTDVRRHENV
jgi:hypothetical protein